MNTNEKPAKLAVRSAPPETYYPRLGGRLPTIAPPGLRSIMKNNRLTRSIIVLNVPGTGPLGLLRVCHVEGEDPVARLKNALAGLPHKGHEAGQSGEAGTVNWPQLMALIKSANGSADQMYVEHVDHWDVLPIEASVGES